VDFSVTSGGRTVMLPIFLRQEGLPFYAFSPDGTILTLFAHFPWDVDNLNKTFITELATPSIANAVETLVIKGNSITDAQLMAINFKAGTGNLLPGLKNLSLPDFTAIPDDCFDSAYWMRSFSAPEVTTIGEGAFLYCENLYSVSFPKVTTIKRETFYMCTGLTSIDLLAATKIEDYAFCECHDLVSVYLPEALTIGWNAFALCSSLVSVPLPAATTIETSAFNYCLALTSVDLPAATKIGTYAFNNCSALTSVDLPAATKIEERAFQACPLLTTLKLNATGTITLGTNLFSSTPNGSSQVELHLGASVSPARPASLPVTNAPWNNYTWAKILAY
jgi:hypothetical protein